MASINKIPGFEYSVTSSQAPKWLPFAPPHWSTFTPPLTLSVRLGSGRAVELDPTQARHIDHGYTV